MEWMLKKPEMLYVVKYYGRSNDSLRIASYRNEYDAKYLCKVLETRVMYDNCDPLENSFLVKKEEHNWIKHPIVEDALIKLSIHADNNQEKCDLDQSLIDMDDFVLDYAGLMNTPFIENDYTHASIIIPAEKIESENKWIHRRYVTLGKLQDFFCEVRKKKDLTPCYVIG